MGEIISRTAGNVYNKLDKDLWLVMPRKKEPYSFFDPFKYTVAQDEEDINLEDIDFKKLIEKIRKMKVKIEE